jgi:2-(1,2-epoxy-1,2-dihydrophenyl)acetyl-CoA isomerase
MPDVETNRDGAVLTITLNRPDVLNALNTALHKALRSALKDARDPEVRAVVLTGAGRGFCVGQDLREFQEAAGDISGRLRETYHPNVRAIRELEKPVIAAVNGAAAGAGLSLACACDIRIAADSATFVPAFVNIGLVPDSGGSYFIGRLLGPARAFEWLASNRRLSAEEALAWGVVNRLCEPGRVLEEVLATASVIADNAPLSIRQAKKAIGNGLQADLRTGMLFEIEAYYQLIPTADRREGIAAYNEKRKPAFKGA